MALDAVDNKHFTISELDMAGSHIANYIDTTVEKSRRIDVITPHEPKSHNYIKNAIQVFLPVGYPNSVTADYLPYQIYDSLQAFSSSIAGMITSRAVLEGIGVGDSSVSPNSALLLSVFQDCLGRLVTILFAHHLGTSLEPECKMYRFVADIANDTAMIMDCLSPAFPKTWRLPLWCLSSILRSICGVAAGSSKASLSAHFATEGNLGELNAKDSSQETVISLLGMLAGSLIVPYITSKWVTWLSLIFLLCIHLGTNYLAVKSICMRTFNRQRANLFFSQVIHDLYMAERFPMEREEAAFDKLVSGLSLPSPQQISQREKIFEHDGILRWSDGTHLGYCKIGVSLKCILNCLGRSQPRTGSFSDLPTQLFDKLLHIYRHSNYILYYDEPRRTCLVVIKLCENRSIVEAHLKAWIQALFITKYRRTTDNEPMMITLERSQRFADRLMRSIISCSRINEIGWDLTSSAMETRPSTRIVIDSGSR